jgi:predicted dehydrogenase
VAYYRRGYPAVQRVRALVDSGSIGQVERGSINNEFPTSHRLDLVHYLLGDIRVAKRIAGGKDPFGFEAMAPRFEVETASGAIIRMITPWAESGMPEALRLEGDAGTIHLTDLKGGRLVVVTERGRVDEDAGSLPHTHRGIVENFVGHLFDGRPLLCDGAEGRKSTVILDALAVAPENGEWTEVDYGE